MEGCTHKYAHIFMCNITKNFIENPNAPTLSVNRMSNRALDCTKLLANEPNLYITLIHYSSNQIL